MAKKDDLFIGYKSFKKDAYKTFKPENSPLDGKYSSELKVIESAVDIFINHDWVDVFEEYLPYVENCINELRSFLRRDEELINVQLANNININETLTYMTKHTDIIESYDEVDQEVTPGKLINIFNESTYDIYENRFVFTLVNLCSSFFEGLMDEIEKSLGKHYYTIKYNSSREETENRRLCTNEENSVHQLVYTKTQKELDDLEQSIPDLKRVKKIHSEIKEMYDTELIQSLKGCKEVTSPLTMTNVLQKNPNFQKAVSFWDFLTTYVGEKFRIERIERTIKAPSKLRTALLEMSNLKDMVDRYSFDADFAKQMDANYADYTAKLKEEEKKAKKAQEAEVQARIKFAVESQASKDKIVREEMEKRYKRVISIFQAVSNKDLDDAVKEFNKRADAELEDRLNFENSLRNKYVEDFATLKDSFDVEYQAFRHQMQIEKNEFIIDHNNQLRAFEESQKREIDKLNSRHTAEMHRTNVEYEKNKKELIQTHKAELLARENSFKAESEALINDYEAKIAALVKEYDSKIANMNDDFTIEKNSLIQDMQGDKDLVVADYEEKLSRADYRAQKTVEENNTLHEQELADLKKSFEEEKANIKKDHEHEVEMMKMNLHTQYNSLDTDSKLTISKERKEHEETLNKLMDDHRVEIETLKANYAIEIEKYAAVARDAEDKFESLKNEYDRKLNLQGNHYETVLADSDAKHKRDLSLLAKTYKKDLDNTIESYKEQEKEYKHTLAQYKAAIENNNKRSADDLERVRLAYETKLSRQQSKYDDELMKMQEDFNANYSDINKKHGAELEKKQKEVASLEKEISKENDHSTQLEAKIAALQFELNKSKQAYSELKKKKARQLGIELKEDTVLDPNPEDVPEDDSDNNTYDGTHKSYEEILSQVEESTSEAHDDSLNNEPVPEELPPVVEESDEVVVEDVPEPVLEEETVEDAPVIEDEAIAAEEEVVEEDSFADSPEEVVAANDKKAEKQAKKQARKDAKSAKKEAKKSKKEEVVAEEAPTEESPVEESVSDEPVMDDAPVLEDVQEEVAEPVVEEPVPVVIEEPTSEPVEEPAAEVIEESVQDEPVLEEVVSEEPQQEGPSEYDMIVDDPDVVSKPAPVASEEIESEEAPSSNLDDSEIDDQDLVSSEILDQLITKAVTPADEEVPLSRREQRKVKKAARK